LNYNKIAVKAFEEDLAIKKTAQEYLDTGNADLL
jgi:hypothetical protein